MSLPALPSSDRRTRLPSHPSGTRRSRRSARRLLAASGRRFASRPCRSSAAPDFGLCLEWLQAPTAQASAPRAWSRRAGCCPVPVLRRGWAGDVRPDAAVPPQRQCFVVGPVGPDSPGFGMKRGC